MSQHFNIKTTRLVVSLKAEDVKFKLFIFHDKIYYFDNSPDSWYNHRSISTDLLQSDEITNYCVFNRTGSSFKYCKFSYVSDKDTHKIAIDFSKSEKNDLGITRLIDYAYDLFKQGLYLKESNNNNIILYCPIK